MLARLFVVTMWPRSSLKRRLSLHLTKLILLQQHPMLAACPQLHLHTQFELRGSATFHRDCKRAATLELWCLWTKICLHQPLILPQGTVSFAPLLLSYSFISPQAYRQAYRQAWLFPQFFSILLTSVWLRWHPLFRHVALCLIVWRRDPSSFRHQILVS